MDKKLRQMRKGRSRLKTRGYGQRLRVSVYRSLKGIYIQLIDDEQGKTILAGRSDRKGKGTKTEAAFVLGQKIAEQAAQDGIEMIVFDRGGYRYHGRVKAVAEGLRQGGLKF